ncbi:MAG: 16S rRNA (cytidine(1402)-2'-O)-methyltransferase [Proteobacteria bacterium]|nr:16S rRNA (cytidine(1402)-2'-O)-methyltransferase [Pseudomonadota bacterium]
MGKLYVVATPIGNLEDISPRARDILSQVAWIAAEDTRHSQVLLQHLGISTALVSYHDFNESKRASTLIDKLSQGQSGALISDAGTPLISDPGYTLVGAAHDAGIKVVPIPGPCSLISALSVAGLPTDKFLFEGFLPAKPQARYKRLQELAQFAHTMIFFEAPHRLEALLRDCENIFSPHRQATLAREITKKFESIQRNDLQGLLQGIQTKEVIVKGECILLVSGHKENSAQINSAQTQKMLQVLLAEMPLSTAVKVAVSLTGLPKNALYEMATALQNVLKQQDCL